MYNPKQQPDDHNRPKQQPDDDHLPAHVIVYGGHSFNRNRLSRQHTTYW